MRYVHQTHLVYVWCMDKTQWPSGIFDRKMPPSWCSLRWPWNQGHWKTGTQQTQNPRELLPHTVPNTTLEMFSGKHQHDFSKAYSKIKKIILKKAKTKKELSVSKSAWQALASQNSWKPSWLLAFWKRSQHTSHFIFFIICLWVTCLLLGKGSTWTICVCMLHNMSDHLHHWQKWHSFHTSVAKQKTWIMFSTKRHSYMLSFFGGQRINVTFLFNF